jgi:hypothetical protein
MEDIEKVRYVLNKTIVGQRYKALKAEEVAAE